MVAGENAGQPKGELSKLINTVLAAPDAALVCHDD